MNSILECISGVVKQFALLLREFFILNLGLTFIGSSNES